MRVANASNEVFETDGVCAYLQTLNAHAIRWMSAAPLTPALLTCEVRGLPVAVLLSAHVVPANVVPDEFRVEGVG